MLVAMCGHQEEGKVQGLVTCPRLPEMHLLSPRAVCVGQTRGNPSELGETCSPTIFRALGILLKFPPETSAFPQHLKPMWSFTLAQCLNNKKVLFKLKHQETKQNKTTLLSKGKAFQFYRRILCGLYSFGETHFNLWFILPHHTC